MQIVDPLLAQQAAFAATMDLTLEQYQLLTARCSTEELISLCDLLRVRKPRSGFRASVAAQVRKWLDEPSSVGKPLSKKQFDAIAPKWPVKFKLPTRPVGIPDLAL